MFSNIVSAIAFILAGASFAFTFWSRRESKRVHVAQKLGVLSEWRCRLSILSRTARNEVEDLIRLGDREKTPNMQQLLDLRKLCIGVAEVCENTENSIEEMMDYPPRDSTLVALAKLEGIFVANVKSLEHCLVVAGELRESMVQYIKSGSPKTGRESSQKVGGQEDRGIGNP